MQEILGRMRGVLSNQQESTCRLERDEEKTRENHRQRIISDNVNILEDVTQNLFDYNFNADECAEGFNQCRQHIIEEAEKKLASEILSKKTDYPIVLGCFKTWKELINVKELSVDEKILEYLNSGEYPLSTRKVARQLQAIPVEFGVTGGYVYDILFFLREHNLEPASLEDLFVFSFTYKNLKKYSEFREMHFYSFGFRLDRCILAATTKRDEGMTIYLTEINHELYFSEKVRRLLVYPTTPADSRPRKN